MQLATLVMEGVETALLVNDACGSPVPWPVCCPWLFFDGKLFHTKLSRTQTVRDLHELCEHRGELIMKVEKLRKAILDGLVLTPLPPRPAALAPMHEQSCKRDKSYGNLMGDVSLTWFALLCCRGTSRFYARTI